MFMFYAFTATISHLELGSRPLIAHTDTHYGIISLQPLYLPMKTNCNKIMIRNTKKSAEKSWR